MLTLWAVRISISFAIQPANGANDPLRSRCEFSTATCTRQISPGELINREPMRASRWWADRPATGAIRQLLAFQSCFRAVVCQS